jgi:hypothetical protein
MHFQLHNPALQGGYLGKYDWTLEKKDGAVCRSYGTFATEKEARSDIAATKTSMKGAGRCKVLSPGEEPS